MDEQLLAVCLIGLGVALFLVRVWARMRHLDTDFHAGES